MHQTLMFFLFPKQFVQSQIPPTMITNPKHFDIAFIQDFSIDGHELRIECLRYWSLFHICEYQTNIPI